MHLPRKGPALGGADRRSGKEQSWWGPGSKQSPPTAPCHCTPQAPLTLLTLQPLHPAHVNSTQRSKPFLKRVAVAPTGVSQPHMAPVTQEFFHRSAWQGSSSRACPPHGGRWLRRHPELQEEVRMHLERDPTPVGAGQPAPSVPALPAGTDPTKHSKAPWGLPPAQGHCQPWLVQKRALGDNFQLPARRLLHTPTLALGAGKSSCLQPGPDPL